MKKSIIVLSFILSAHLVQADDVGSTTQKMEFILERIAAFDEKGVDQLLRLTPFTQNEIDGCIDYIEEHGADLIDPGETERIALAITIPAITFSLIGLACKFTDAPELRTLICAYVAFSFFLHPILSLGNSAIVKIKLVKLTRIMRRLLAHKPESHAEPIAEAA